MHEGHTHEHKAPEPKLLLGYMLEHNLQHQAELSEVADKLKTSGQTEAADLVLEAINAFKTGNSKLESALKIAK